MGRAIPSIGLLGTLTYDTTIYADGARSENPGGLHYSLLALAHLFAGGARIVPVANIGDDAFDAIHARLDLPGVERALLRRVPQRNNHVLLTYRSADQRDEVLVGLVPPVSWEHLAGLGEVDWMLVNLISGRDVELATLERLRRTQSLTLQLDVHSLTLGIDPQGRRFLRKPETWEKWVACADWVQMNETEARLLGDGRTLEELARHVLSLGVRGVLVTLGARGCFAAWRESDSMRTLHLEAARHPEPAFPTGCGDVFGAGFAYAMLQGAPPEAGVRFANAAAGAKAGREACTDLRRLRQYVARDLELFVPNALRP